MKRLLRNGIISPAGLKALLAGRLIRKLAPKKTDYAAVDIGSREIKVVQVSIADGSPVVTASGRLPTPVGALDTPINESELVNALNKVILASGIRVNEVIATISGDRVITRHVKLPVMPARELEAAVNFEIERFVPVPVEELIIRYVNLGVIKSGGERFFHLLLAAVPASFVYDYYGIFAKAGLNIAVIDLQSLSLWRLFSGLKTSAARKGTVGIFDIGASTTQFLVVRDRALQLTRTLPVGGNLLTRSLAAHYGLGYLEAQRMKEDEGELFSVEQAASATASAMQTDFSLRDGLTGLVREIRRSLDYYAAQENATAIERYIISGGTSKMKGFRDFFAEAMGTPVDFGYPGVPGVPGDDPTAARFDPAFAVVLGSALREVVE
ncbi:MAG: Competence protein A [Pelotomaculum sp. PtaB.Bin013]|uniref:Type IV pilus assembly protein PilM n=1 Tax=Pelotomaculum isophthalicicum JI TaxID=947010 RepID=A0A9X4GZC8_9FIRM|nr:type IV pilus assembly protein PilM [Pelotomaculum isophthalicicum]MDF9408615.1 type IV pilus assembly protein PilM [Pelotomaculum isophthalicicum JI]OPX87097.1 MAG: Competence protein A [Pelotomaculum sp. PtaB.Bin013]